MKVKVYTTKTCIWCAKTKEFLNSHKIKFTEIDVTKNIKGRKEMIKKTHQLGVPVVDIDGKVIIGHDEDELKSALKIK